MNRYSFRLGKASKKLCSKMGEYFRK